MLRRLLLFIICLFPGIAIAQNLTGKWLGELPQTNKNVKFKLEMDIIQTGKTLSGTSTFISADNHKALFLLRGSVDGKSIVLEEYKGVSCDCEDGRYEFCLKKMKGIFSVDSLNRLFVIDGTWSSEKSFNGKDHVASVCDPGLFTIVRQAFIRPLDGTYRPTNIPNSTKVARHASLRETDALFAKRVWREIDLREKVNQFMASPKQRLIDVIVDAVQARDVAAYDPTPTKNNPNGDSFITRLTIAQALSKLADSTVVDKFDKKTGDKIGSAVVAGEFNPDEIVKFRIKEDWLFDKQRGIFEPRIVGIAPLIQVKTKAGISASEYQPAFWLYFPELRSILATKAVANRSSDATGLSYDDIFMKRMFASYITKESNDRDERIRDYAQGVDRLNESERIKKSLMNWELSLW